MYRLYSTLHSLVHSVLHTLLFLSEHIHEVQFHLWRVSAEVATHSVRVTVSSVLR